MVYLIFADVFHKYAVTLVLCSKAEVVREEANVSRTPIQDDRE